MLFLFLCKSPFVGIVIVEFFKDPCPRLIGKSKKEHGQDSLAETFLSLRKRKICVVKCVKLGLPSLNILDVCEWSHLQHK